jgi:hypothetical protein
MAKDDRLRLPVDDPYLHALGLAIFCFSRLEWDAVFVAHRIGQNGHNPTATADYISTISKKTAGTIAKDLVRLAAGIADPGLSRKVEAPAKRFEDLVVRRNALMHANPATSPSKKQRLFRYADEWTIADVNDLADDFTECAGELNHLIHHVL